MGEFQQKLGIAAEYLYGANMYQPTVFKISVRVKDMVSPEILKYAVDRAYERFPYFKVEFVRKKSEIYLKENKEEVVIKDRTKSGILGSKENNHQLVQISYHEKKIYFEAFHGLCDGGGFNPFMMQVLYYYFCEYYQTDIEYSDFYLNSVFTKEEIKDPLEVIFDEKTPFTSRISDSYPFQMPERYIGRDDAATEYYIKIPMKEFMRFTKDHDGSPAAVLVLLMSRAIETVHESAKGHVRAGMVLNMRPALGMFKSHHSLITTIPLDYSLKLHKFGTRDQLTCYRGMIFAQSIDENIRYKAKKQKDISVLADSVQTLEEKKKEVRKKLMPFPASDTFQLSYVGKLNLQNMEQYIEDIYTTVNTRGIGMQIEVMTKGENFCISIMQEFESDIYVQAFLRELEKEEIFGQWKKIKNVWISSVIKTWEIEES